MLNNNMNMIKAIALGALILVGNTAVSQLVPTKPTIEIVGEAHKEVTPDEIYVLVHMIERYDGREKITIDAQQQQLMGLMAKKGLDLESITLSGGNASYVKIPWKTKKDVLATADYEVMVATADDAAKVFEAVDELDISNCRIGRVDHSQREEFEKEVRIDAMKDAAAKADYMLKAVGSKRGATLHVTENQAPSQFNVNTANYDRWGNANVYSKSASDFQVSFKKIDLKSNVFIKFEIE
jgi:uncharacterized protein